MMKRRFLFLIGLACILLTSCSSDITKDIVGSWHGVVVQQDLTFYADGLIKMESPNHSTYEGSYTIRDGNQLNIVFPALSRPINCTAKISSNDLTLTHPSGREENYVRR